MAFDTVCLGYEAKCQVNGSMFAIRRGEITMKADEHETGDTESGRYKRYKPGRYEAEANIEFFEDTVQSPWSAPFNFYPGQSITLTIYPQGVGGPTWTFDSFVVSSMRNTIDITQPIMNYLSGKADNTFYWPS